MLLYICTKFRENILNGIKVIEQTRFSLEKYQKGRNFTKIIGGVIVLVLCTLSDTSLFSTQFHEFLSCRVDMICILILSKGHNSAKTVDEL